MSGQTVIIKRKRVVSGGGHHGGAWKVAYADFVTAMMAFFLLMWLLNATTEEQRKGLADYFDPTIPISAISGGGSDLLMGDDVIASKDMAASIPPMFPRAATVSSVEEALESAVAQTGVSGMGERMRVSRIEDGVQIELIDEDSQPFFTTGSAAGSNDLAALLGAVGDVIVRSGAPVKITGHTDGYRYMSADYTNWELSADRANTARRLLLAAGVPENVVVEVSGKADRAPVGGDALGASNRRIAITLLTGPEKHDSAQATDAEFHESR